MEAINHEIHMGNNDRKIAGLKEFAATIGQVTFAETKLITLQKQADAYNKAQAELEKFTSERNITLIDNEVQAEIKNVNTKQALQRRVEAVRFAQEELNNAIKEEIHLLELENGSLDRKITKTRSVTAHIQHGTGALKVQGMTTKQTEAATEQLTMAVMRLSMQMMKLGIGIFMAEMAVMMFKDAIPGIDSEAQAARISLILMGMAMAVMTAEMMVSISTMALSTVTSGANTVATGFLATAQFILTGSSAAAATATSALAVSLTFLKGVMTAGAFVVLMIGMAVAIDKYVIPKMKKWLNITTDTTEELGKLEETTLNYASSVQQSMDALDFSAFDTGVDQMENFNSRREELFFGFKAGQVTGDLIKQVQQGGVDSFIANTEIIMNNNFNGMTTEEVTDEILRQLELKVGGLGVITS